MDEKPPMYSESHGQYPQLPPQGQPQQPYPPQGQQYPPQGQQYPPQGQQPYQPHVEQPYLPQVTQPGSQTVVVTQPNIVVVGSARLGANPQGMTCMHCQANIVTRITYETGLLTWLVVGALCVFILWPCCLIPFCIDGCKDVQHHCPNCNRLIGTHSRLT